MFVSISIPFKLKSVNVVLLNYGLKQFNDTIYHVIMRKYRLYCVI